MPAEGIRELVWIGSSLEAAAVEARRLSSLLERYDDESPGTNVGMRAFLRYFAGTIFEAARQRNDAAVAYRNARAMLPGLEAPDTSARGDTGEVILLVEGDDGRWSTHTPFPLT